MESAWLQHSGLTVVFMRINEIFRALTFSFSPPSRYMAFMGTLTCIQSLEEAYRPYGYFSGFPLPVETSRGPPGVGGKGGHLLV